MTRDHGTTGRRPLLLPVLAAVWSVAACGGGDAPGPATTVSDSAGVRIVDHGQLVYDRLPRWSLGGTPVVRIGVVEGDADREWEEIVAADRLADGTLVALDRGFRQVRAFDPSGRHLWSSGREGEGPGEYSFPIALWAGTGDSLFVSDPASTRLTVLGARGAVLDPITVESPDGLVVGHGPVGDGSVLVELRRIVFTDPEARRELVMYSRLGGRPPGGGEPISYGEHEFARQHDPIGGGAGFFSPPHFAGPAVFTGSPEGVWFSKAEGYVLTLLAEDGRAVRIVRWAGPDRTIRPADLERLREVTLAEAADEPEILPSIETFVRDQPVADGMSTFERLLTDRSGRLWVQDYARPDFPGADAAWLILSLDGEAVLGRLTHEPSLRLLAVGEDWVLGRAEDDLGVQYLELRTLRPPA